jgi:threonine dehydrogenase-like Zn-dependent dehydrogenase
MAQTARAVLFHAPGQPWELREYPVPAPEPGAILVRLHLTNICGSDLHQWRGDGGSPIPPGGRVLGHEMVGEVAALGQGVTTDSLGQPLGEGDRVVYAYFIPCRRCRACTQGRFSVCPQRLAHYQDPAGTWPYFVGGFADYYYVRPGQFVFRVPDGVPDSAVTPANCAVAQVVHGLTVAGLTAGQTVAIQGAGALGLYAAALADSMGAGRIVVLDAVPARLAAARRFGADDAISVTDTSREERVARVTEATGGGADLVLELVGLPDVIPEGLEMVAPGGTYLDMGLLAPALEVTLRPAQLLRRNLRYVGLNHYEPIALARALEFLEHAADRYPFSEMVTREYGLEQIEQAFQESDWARAEGDAAPVGRTGIRP